MRTKKTLESILIWFKLSRIHSYNVTASNRILKEFDLSLAQFDVIAQLGVGEELTQSQLTEKLLVTKGNTSQLLRAMEEKGFIRRRQEWKTKFVSLTPQGVELHDRIVPLMESFQNETFSDLDDHEREELLNLLRKVEKHIHD